MKCFCSVLRIIDCIGLFVQIVSFFVLFENPFEYSVSKQLLFLFINFIGIMLWVKNIKDVFNY